VSLTTAEQLALAVLRGDEVAANALADEVCLNGLGRGGTPVTFEQLAGEGGRLRVVVSLPDDPGLTGDLLNHLDGRIQDWLNGGRPTLFLLPGITLRVFVLPAYTTDAIRLTSRELTATEGAFGVMDASAAVDGTQDMGEGTG
jgi:hypothetical protein